ncbi:hypothetical protein TNCV_3482671 [Trichonephila clavipes]|nr:hypothetical protein TNCV_3482671 [Trichonephila clavipes]
MKGVIRLGMDLYNWYQAIELARENVKEACEQGVERCAVCNRPCSVEMKTVSEKRAILRGVESRRDTSWLAVKAQFEAGLNAENDSTSVREIPCRIRPALLQTVLEMCNGKGQSAQMASSSPQLPFVDSPMNGQCSHRCPGYTSVS